ncbi:MAG: DUF2397 domain-containing protein [Solirubrobacteraceae bacterium]
MADPERLRLYRYVTAPEAGDYLAIMGVFTSTLLVEWSPQDLVDHGVDLPVEVVAARCRKLEEDGNLLLSPREVRVTSIAEYQSQPVRYTVSALGGRLHREVAAFLSVTGGAREVPRELLAVIADGLAHLDPAGAPESLAATVLTIFGQFQQFAASVTDFYTYIGSVLSRSDLEGEEWSGFKALLIDYLESIVESVRLHAPVISGELDGLLPAVPAIIERINQGDGVFAAPEAANPGGEQAERAQGRRAEDWEQLRDWFSGPGARQLRDAAHRAVGSLLASLKRINAASSSEASLRRHFLKLAGWFDRCDSDDAHVLAVAVFGAYPSRHIAVPLEPDVGDAVPATASWWSAPAAPVPVSLRERGDRTPRGRSAAAADHRVQRRRLLERREAEALRRAAACEELLAVGARLEEALISSAAMEVFLELLAGAAGSGEARLADHPVEIWLSDSAGISVIRSEMGGLTLHGRAVQVGAPGARRMETVTFNARAKATL